jgi:hypothetical protein
VSRLPAGSGKYVPRDGNGHNDDDVAPAPTSPSAGARTRVDGESSGVHSESHTGNESKLPSVPPVSASAQASPPGHGCRAYPADSPSMPANLPEVVRETIRFIYGYYLFEFPKCEGDVLVMCGIGRTDWFFRVCMSENEQFQMQFRTRFVKKDQKLLTSLLGVLTKDWKCRSVRDTTESRTEEFYDANGSLVLSRQVDNRGKTLVELFNPDRKILHSREFKKFLVTAIQRYCRIQQTLVPLDINWQSITEHDKRLETLLPWVRLGAEWHQHEYGFPYGMRREWPPALVNSILSMLQQWFDKNEFRWSFPDRVELALPNGMTWMRLWTKRPTALEIELCQVGHSIDLRVLSQAFGETNITMLDGNMILRCTNIEFFQERQDVLRQLLQEHRRKVLESTLVEKHA